MIKFNFNRSMDDLDRDLVHWLVENREGWFNDINERIIEVGSPPWLLDLEMVDAPPEGVVARFTMWGHEPAMIRFGFHEDGRVWQSNIGLL